MAADSGIGDLLLTEGGQRRQDSVRAALGLLPPDADMVCVHDAARPLCPPAVFDAVVSAATRCGAATAAVPLVDSVKRVVDGMVVETLDRSALLAVQTPQAFARVVLVEAHASALVNGVAADDDCALVEHLGRPVAVVPGDPANAKITVPSALRLLGLRLPP